MNYVLMQRTGFAHYYWTGSSFNVLLLIAKRYPSRRDAEREKARLVAKDSRHSSLEVETVRT